MAERILTESGTFLESNSGGQVILPNGGVYDSPPLNTCVATGGIKVAGISDTLDHHTIESYTATSGIKVSGIGYFTRTYAYTSSGGVKTSGVASTSLGTVRIYTSSGGVKTSGVALTGKYLGYNFTSVGGIKSSGAATTVKATIYIYIGSGKVDCSISNTDYAAHCAEFNNESYLYRLIRGQTTKTGNGAFFWNYDPYWQRPGEKNFLISKRNSFGDSKKFTWAFRFKADPRLQYISGETGENIDCVLGSVTLSGSNQSTGDCVLFVGFGVYGLGYRGITIYSQGPNSYPNFVWTSYYVAGHGYVSLDEEHRIVIQYDSAQVTEANRIKVYLDGVAVTKDSTVSVMPSLNENAYELSTGSVHNFYGIGGAYFAGGHEQFQYNFDGSHKLRIRQFVGCMYESIFLDSEIKSDSELFDSEYMGPYASIYSYHLKYNIENLLGYDSNNGINYFIDNEVYEEDLIFTGGYYKPLQVHPLEPILSAKDVSFIPYANGKKFTFYSKVYIPDCIRYYAIYNDYYSGQCEATGDQTLQNRSYALDHPDKFTFAARIWIDPRLDASCDLENSQTPNHIFQVALINNGNYKDFFEVCTMNSLGHSSSYDEDAYHGQSIHVGCKSVGLPTTLNIDTKPQFLTSNRYHRLVVHVDTSEFVEYNRVKIYVDGRLIDFYENEFSDGTTESDYPTIYDKVLFNDDPYDYVSISIGSQNILDGLCGPTNTTNNWSSWLGKITDAILVDGLLIDPEIILPMSGSYSGTYGGQGGFHFKFDNQSNLGLDFGPNGYNLTDYGTESVISELTNENEYCVLYAVQSQDSYHIPYASWFSFLFKNTSAGHYLGYDYYDLNENYYSAYCTNSLSVDTWYDIQINVDTTQSIPEDRIKIIIDKTLQSYDGTPDHILQDTNIYSGTGLLYEPRMLIGGYVEYYTWYLNAGFTGYLRNTKYIDGVILPIDFFDNPSVPINYGAEGFSLNYDDPDNLGYSSCPTYIPFTVNKVTQHFDYASNYDKSISLALEIFQNTESIPDLLLPFKLVSGIDTELVLPFEILVSPIDLLLIFKLDSIGESVELILPFNLINNQIYLVPETNEEELIVTFSSPIQTTFEGLNTFVIQDTSQTINYLFGTSESDVNSINGWVNTTSGEITVFPENIQLSNGATDIISNESSIIVSYSYDMNNYQSWQLSCSIDGSLIELVGEATIENEENASAVATFTVSGLGNTDPLLILGRSVVLSYSATGVGGASAGGGTVFTGIVADVQYDVDKRFVNVTADTRLPDYFNSLTREEIANIVGGYWSPWVWDDESDSSGWAYAQERLSTTSTFVWHDSIGSLRISDFLVKNSATSFSDSERFHESLKVEFAQRSEMINKVKVNLDFRYQRKRQRSINVEWKDPSGGNIQTFLCNMATYQICQRSMVEGAASGSDWVPISPIIYTPLWPAQIVQCGPGMYDFIVWGVGINEIYTPRKDKDGNWEKVIMVNKDTGSTKQSSNTVYKETTDNVTTYYEGYEATPGVSQGQEYLTPDSVTSKLCIGAKWKAARRWLQDVDEYYELVVHAPDSIDAIGEVVKEESYTLDSNVDNSDWESSLKPYKEPSTQGSFTIEGSNDIAWNSDENTDWGTSQTLQVTTGSVIKLDYTNLITDPIIRSEYNQNIVYQFGDSSSSVNSRNGYFTKNKGTLTIYPVEVQQHKGASNIIVNGQELSISYSYADGFIVNREKFNEAQEVILNAAKYDILRAHRLTTVSFKVAFRSVDLGSDASVSSTYVKAEGKIKKYKHTFSIDSGEASTEIFVAIFRNNGGGLVEISSEPTPVARPAPLKEDTISSKLVLSNYVGGRVYETIGFTGKWYDGRAEGSQDPITGEWEEEPWVGFMTNYESPVSTTTWASLMAGPPELVNEAAFKFWMDVTAYTIPYQFVMKGPTIDEKYTSTYFTAVNGNTLYDQGVMCAPDKGLYCVAIPQDELVLTS